MQLGEIAPQCDTWILSFPQELLACSAPEKHWILRHPHKKNPMKAPSGMLAGTRAMPWRACTTSKQASCARKITWWGFQEPARKTWTSYICHSKLCIFLPDSYHKVPDWSDAAMGWVSLHPSEAPHLQEMWKSGIASVFKKNEQTWNISVLKKTFFFSLIAVNYHQKKTNQHNSHLIQRSSWKIYELLFNVVCRDRTCKSIVVLKRSSAPFKSVLINNQSCY